MKARFNVFGLGGVTVFLVALSYAAAPVLGVSFTDYFPLTPAAHGVKTFQWVYGRTGTYRSYVSGSIVAPYTSGSIEATGIVNLWGSNEQVFFTNNGSEVQWIGWQGVDGGNDLEYLSTDENFTAHPATWTFSEITHGMFVDQGLYCSVDSNFDLLEWVDDQALLFTVGDITVPSGQYEDAIVLWWLDKKYPYVALDFHGQDSGMGIVPPNSGQTHGYSVTGWEVYGYGIGLIAQGDCEAQIGNVPDVAVLIAQTAPVYRFWSSANSRHFYTISGTEKQKLINTYSHVWTYEGLAYSAHATAGEASLTPVYRFWSEVLGGHFYTTNTAERDKLINNYSDVWTYEGSAFYAYPEGSAPAEASPVYRFWSDTLGGHFYTINETERDKLINTYSHVWAYEGIAWYAYK